MIPKIIHYCWLSGEPYPALVTRCIESWKQKLPDFELILWDSDRINISSNLWLSQTYKNKKYAFAADYIRFYALYHYGGIYLDADVEVLKSFNPLLNQIQFIGEEASGDIEAAVIGTEKGLPWVKQCLDYYENRPFIKANGKLDIRPVPLLVANILTNSDVKIKPFYYFSPKNINTGKIYITNKTFCIHHFDGKWIKKGFYFKFKRIIHYILHSLIGRKNHNKIVQHIRKIKKINAS